MDNFLPYARQSIDASDSQEVSAVLESLFITRGPKVKEFESTIAAYCEAKFAVAFNSGSTALAAAYFAADAGPNDRIITTPNSFIATVGPAISRGAKHIFLDIDRKTGNFKIDHLEHNINLPSSRGRTFIVPVHFSGIAIDMRQIDSMIQDPETVIIEDAAHALGSCYPDGTKVGSCAWSDMTVFSFHPAKTLTTGEGGLVTTNSEIIAHQLELFRNNCIEREAPYLTQTPAPWHYEVVNLSGNYNFTEFQAALGLSQFKRLDQFIAKRRELIRLYRKLLGSVDHLQMFSPEYDDQTAFSLCTVQIDFEKYGKNRAGIMEALKNRGIGTQVHYIPLYRHPVFERKTGDLSAFFPETEAYYSQALSLPLYFDLKPEEVEKVVNTLIEELNL